jgi:hypothetical protein
MQPFASSWASRVKEGRHAAARWGCTRGFPAGNQILGFGARGRGPTSPLPRSCHRRDVQAESNYRFPGGFVSYLVDLAGGYAGVPSAVPGGASDCG